MRTVFLLMFLCCVTRANYSIICNESSKDGLYFNRSDDGVEGRYVVKWCTRANKTVNLWRLDVLYKTVSEPKKCDGFMFSGKSHSSFEEGVQLTSNCTHVCFVAYLDLIFNATCYVIKTRQISQSTSSQNELTVMNYDGSFYITNEWPKEHFINSRAKSAVQSDGEDVVFDWFLGHVPALDYWVQLFREDNKDTAIYMNCSTVEPTHVRCRARAPFGNYTALFRHGAPWARVNFVDIANLHKKFTHRAPSEGLPSPNVAPSGMWWTLAGAVGTLLLALLLLLLVLAQRARLADKLRSRVHWDWLTRPAGRAERRGGAHAHGRVLLLYARDCQHMRRAADALHELLLHATGCEVVDLYRAETVSAAAPAGGTWLRGLLLRPDTRVLLLQSPALALYSVRLADAEGEPMLQAPLLGGRVAWRCPHAADALLQLALRLLADGAGDPLPYKKYYVASVSDVPHADVVPALTPQRRYPLPLAAELLLRDLAPADPVPADPAQPAPVDPVRELRLRQLTEALEEFREYALADPNYLSKDLVYD